MSGELYICAKHYTRCSWQEGNSNAAIVQCKEKPAGDKYGFGYFSRQLNSGKGVNPLFSDSRRRPDRHALEVMVSKLAGQHLRERVLHHSNAWHVISHAVQCGLGWGEDHNWICTELVWRNGSLSCLRPSSDNYCGCSWETTAQLVVRSTPWRRCSAQRRGSAPFPSPPSPLYLLWSIFP